MQHGAGCGCPSCITCAQVSHDHDLYLRQDAFGNEYYADPIPALDPAALAALEAEVAATSSDDGTVATAGALIAPIYHSNPTASKKIFLDFDGHIVTNTLWNSRNNNKPIHAPAYSADNNTASFSQTDLAQIEKIWKRVAEDFAPFDVDVTTEDPGLDLLTAGGKALRVLISTDVDDAAMGGTGNRWYSNAGGVAYLNSWNWTSDTPVWVFENNLGSNEKKYVAEAASHEAGHAFGLQHDGRPNDPYYKGHGDSSNDATGWASIMGVGYYRPLSQWSKGEYNNANNKEDDVAKIAQALSFRTDDHGDEITKATALTAVDGAVSGGGIIATRTDADYFSFFTGAGEVSFSFKPYEVTNGVANLDLFVELYDTAGEFILSNNPINQLTASFSTILAAGTYYLKVDGTGEGNPLTTGYTDYGSLGQYTFTGTVVEGTNNQAPRANADTAATEQLQPILINVLANDTDPDGDLIYLEAVGIPSNGRVELVDGEIRYTPNASFAGQDTFVYTIRDQYGAMASGNVLVSVANLNPVALLDEVETGMGVAALVDVLANDSDPGLDPLALLQFTQASNGAVSRVGNQLSYQPNDEFSGTDEFTYTIEDGNGGTATATVRITVNESQQQPLNLNNYTFTSYSSQDVTRNNLAIQDSGATLRLWGNTWKKIEFPYQVTANTILEFEFASNNQGEIHGIGFEENNSTSTNRVFQVYGTQRWGINTAPTYAGAGEFVTYQVRVGDFFQGNFQYLVFVNDDDANVNSESIFRNIRVYEQESANSLAMTEGSARETGATQLLTDKNVLIYGGDTKSVQTGETGGTVDDSNTLANRLQQLDDRLNALRQRFENFAAAIQGPNSTGVNPSVNRYMSTSAGTNAATGAGNRLNPLADAFINRLARRHTGTDKLLDGIRLFGNEPEVNG